jgi:hypothetical protein
VSTKYRTRPTYDRPPVGEPPDPRHKRRRGGSWGILATIVAAIIVGIIVWVVWTSLDEDSAGPEAGVTLNAITEEPERFFGQTVTISGVAEEDFARAFVIGGGAAGEELLVLPADGVQAPNVSEDDVLQVTGTVERYTPEDVPALNDEELTGWTGEDYDDGEAILRATQITQDAT